MFSEGFVNASYIAAGVLFILALSGLSNQESAKRGIVYGVVGMGIAIFATILGPGVTNYLLLIPIMAVAAVIGWFVANRVEMTQMPQLVAILHSFVGLAAVLVGFNSHFEGGDYVGAEKVIHDIEVFIGVFVGAVTFTGSVIAYGKLEGSIDGKPLALPGRHMMNLAAVIVSLLLGVLFVAFGWTWPLILMTLIAFVFGAHLVSGDGDRRGGHAGRGLDVEFLFRLGCGGGRFHARQLSFDRDRRSGRFVRRNPFLHHVPRHEPELHFGHLRRLGR